VKPANIKPLGIIHENAFSALLTFQNPTPFYSPASVCHSKNGRHFQNALSDTKSVQRDASLFRNTGSRAFQQGLLA
jgi:hypothetical protein